jgi:thiosulfate dehydrogenase [quinone] large subunit
MACLGGVLFLLTTYVIQPPLPGVPEPAKSEGTYLFVNKNTVELLALLVLAVTPSGRWVGLDRLLYNLNPFRRRQPREQAAKAAPTQTQTQGA